MRSENGKKEVYLRIGLSQSIADSVINHITKRQNTSKHMITAQFLETGTLHGVNTVVYVKPVTQANTGFHIAIAIKSKRHSLSRQRYAI